MSDEGIQPARVTKVSDESPLIGARHFVRASFEGQGSRSGTNGPVGLGAPHRLREQGRGSRLRPSCSADHAWFEAHPGRRSRLTEPTPGALRLAECYPRGRTRMDLYTSPVSGNFNLLAARAALSRADRSPRMPQRFGLQPQRFTGGGMVRLGALGLTFHRLSDARRRQWNDPPYPHSKRQSAMAGCAWLNGGAEKAACR